MHDIVYIVYVEAEMDFLIHILTHCQLLKRICYIFFVLFSYFDLIKVSEDYL